jgi:hypothetical protein
MQRKIAISNSSLPYQICPRKLGEEEEKRSTTMRMGRKRRKRTRRRRKKMMTMKRLVIISLKLLIIHMYSIRDNSLRCRCKNRNNKCSRLGLRNNSHIDNKILPWIIDLSQVPLRTSSMIMLYTDKCAK